MKSILLFSFCRYGRSNLCYLMAELVGKEVSLGEGTHRKLRDSRTGDLYEVS